MAKKKKHSGTRTVSRQEREAKLQREAEAFSLKKYLNQNLFKMFMTAIIMLLFCWVADRFMPGDYLVPGIVAFVIAQVYLYYRAYREDKKKNVPK